MRRNVLDTFLDIMITKLCYCLGNNHADHYTSFLRRPKIKYNPFDLHVYYEFLPRRNCLFGYLKTKRGSFTVPK